MRLSSFRCKTPQDNFYTYFFLSFGTLMGTYYCKKPSHPPLGENSIDSHGSKRSTMVGWNLVDGWWMDETLFLQM